MMVDVKGVVRKIWDGPFVVPPIEQPISVGWVLLKVLETIWRIFVTLILAALTVAGSMYFYDRFNRPLKEKLHVSLRDNHQGCRDSPTMPMLLEVTNRSAERIGDWSLIIHAFERGRSTDIADPITSHQRMDAILGPAGTTSFCISRPELIRSPENPITYAASIEWARPAPPTDREPVTAPPPIITEIVPREKAKDQ